MTRQCGSFCSFSVCVPSCKLTVVGNLSARFLNMNLETAHARRGGSSPIAGLWKRESFTLTRTHSAWVVRCASWPLGNTSNRTSLGFLNDRRAKWQHAGIFSNFSSCLWAWFIHAREYHGCKYFYSLRDMQFGTMGWIKWYSPKKRKEKKKSANLFQPYPGVLERLVVLNGHILENRISSIRQWII